MKTFENLQCILRGAGAAAAAIAGISANNVTFGALPVGIAVCAKKLDALFEVKGIESMKDIAKTEVGKTLAQIVIQCSLIATQFGIDLDEVSPVVLAETLKGFESELHKELRNNPFPKSKPGPAPAAN